MDNPHEQARAWRYVDGYDVPRLTPELREQWSALIGALTSGQFSTACMQARQRPVGQLHLRPSVEAFRSYAGGGVRRPVDQWHRIPQIPMDERTDPRQHPAIIEARDALARAKAKTSAKALDRAERARVNTPTVPAPEAETVDA